MSEEVIRILRSLEHICPSKPDTQRRLLAQRAEIARKLSASVRREESRALILLRRPDWSNLSPTLRLANGSDYALWHYLRVCLSSAPWSGRPGRCLRYFVVDRNSGGILGVADLGSELHMLGLRDRWIGWTKDQKFKRGGLRRAINLGTCVPSQPFGWLCGGKFIAEASSTAEVASVWEKKYGDKAAVVCTTSLYGKSSQYNRLPNWKYLGETKGASPHMYLSIADRKTLAKYVLDSGATTRGASVTSFGAVTSAIDVLSTVIKISGYTGKLATGQTRGVYVSELYEGARDDLVAERSTGTPSRTLDEVSAWFVERWAAMRYPKKQHEIESFDWSTYSLDKVIRAGSIESDALATPGGGGRIDPVSALHVSPGGG